MDKNSNLYVLYFNKCNQRCLFCSSDNKINSYRNLTYDLVFEEILKAKSLKYNGIDFYGGEPTCFSFLKKSIKLANLLKLNVTLATNGTSFNSAKYTKDFFNGTEINGMRVSLHSYKADVHDNITQVSGSFQKSVRGIKNILKYYKKLSVVMVINKLNYQDILGMPSFIYSLGVRGINFQALVPCGIAIVNMWMNISPRVFSKELNDALLNAKRLGFDLIECSSLSKSIINKRQRNFVKFNDLR